jgi:hypothetical protein
MFHMIFFSVNCLMYVILLYVVLLVIVLNMAFILLFVFFWIYSIYFWVLYSPPLFLSLSCLILSGSPCFCMCVSSFLCVNCRCYYFSLFHYKEWGHVIFIVPEDVHWVSMIASYYEREVIHVLVVAFQMQQHHL